MTACEPWVDIDRSAIADNISRLRSLLKPGTQFLAAVKANAYGHGAVDVAHVAVAAGADWLGVARAEEGLALRRAGITAPILLFCPTAAEAMAETLAQRLTPSVSSAEEALAWAAHGSTRNPATLHLKVDTGMGRLGCLAQHDGSPTGRAAAIHRVSDTAAHIARDERLRLGGVFTHFAASDEVDPGPTLTAFELFSACLAHIGKRGIATGLRHAANSAALITQPQTHLDLVRSGIAIYGLGLPANRRGQVHLRPALSLKARITLVKSVPLGATISYGMTYRASEPRLIATVPIGYGDGFHRAHSNRGHMLVRGHRAPIIGRVCMDSTMIDVSQIPGVAVGDEVVIIGSQGHETRTAADLAADIGTIDYEVVTSLLPRMQRRYHP